MATGTVKWFNKTKGYGFITPDEGNKDIFIHISELEKVGVSHLNEGQKVGFDITESRGRESASNLEIHD